MNEFPMMIFAAGFGTRMGVLTRDRPKPLVEVAGLTLIDRALELAIDAGADPIVINTHYKAKLLEEHLKNRNVRISQEHPEILDTGGGLKKAQALLEAPVVATLNPDAIWSGPNPFDILWRAWDSRRMEALLLCIPIERTRGRVGEGDFGVDAQGNVRRPGPLVYGGAQIIRTDRVAEVDDDKFSLNRVWDQLLATGSLSFMEYPGYWCDVGSPEGVRLAEEMIEGDV